MEAKIVLQHRVGSRGDDAADGAEFGHQARQRGVVGVERYQNMARPGHKVERDVPRSAGGGQGGDEARPLISFQQDDAAGQGVGRLRVGQNGRHSGFLWEQGETGESGCKSKSRSQEPG